MLGIYVVQSQLPRGHGESEGPRARVDSVQGYK